MRVVFLLLALLTAPLVSAQSDLAKDADAYLKNAVKEHRIPAVSAGIAVDGKILWTGAAGLADIEANTPVTTDTPFRIASISKVLTTIAILQLVEQGVLDLDAAVQTYLPDYPEPRNGTLTVRHLLYHTSGIRHSRGDESRDSLTHYASMIEACEFFKDRKLASVPGKKYRYSSYGFTVLGAVLEAATGDSFESYLREHVWAPAGMIHTGLDKRPLEQGNAARLYRLEGDRLVPDTVNDLSLIYPGGGMVATAEDLLKLTIALENGKLLSGESTARMLGDLAGERMSAKGPGGLGWNVWDHETHGRILSRVGGQSGSSSLLVSYADRGVTVVFLTNLARLDPIWTLTNDLIGMGLKVKQR